MSTDDDRALSERGALARLLDDHEYTIGPNRQACLCGWTLPRPIETSNQEAHRRHLADVIATRVEAARAEGAAEALREASHFTTAPDVEFRDLADVRDWLDTRADRIESGHDNEE